MEQKPKLFNINNFITAESGRLSSLSLKRDLSLGGNKQKKVYKPNLNVVRNKNKTKLSLSNKPQQNQRKNNTKNSNRNNQNQRYVQSSSVFSEGAGDLKRTKVYSDRFSSYSERDTTTIALPKIIKTNWEVCQKEEKTVVDDLLTGYDDSSSESEDDYSPVILPLKENKAGFLKMYQIKKEDPENKEVKREMETIANNRVNHIDNIGHYEVPLAFQNKFYDDNHPCISLVRLPDSLPGKGYTEDSNKITDFDLTQMLEGKIGKVLVRKSGKVEAQIGHMKYLLDTVESNPFKEDIMYVPQDLKSSSFGPDMANLGGIDEKYILCPSWKNLFDLQHSKT